MGYEISDTETLTFPDRPGLEVVVKLATTFEDFERIERIGNEGTGPERDAAFDSFAEAFIDSWNITAKGEPLPTADFRRIELPLKFEILNRWMQLVRGPSAPLDSAPGNTDVSPTPSTDEPDNE